jgi:hypothetical protein
MLYITPIAYANESAEIDEIEALLGKNVVTEDKATLPTDYGSKAILQGINKITARSEKLTVTVGSVTNFGKLEIIVHKCWYAPPDETPESKVLLEIWENRPKEDKIQLFHGWMFASTPALSALEHPVYDITVIKCEK